MTDDMLHVMKWHNGEKEYSPFSDAEMTRRQSDVRRWMAENDVDAALFVRAYGRSFGSGSGHLGRRSFPSNLGGRLCGRNRFGSGGCGSASRDCRRFSSPTIVALVSRRGSGSPH